MTRKVTKLAVACALFVVCMNVAPVLAQPGSTIGIPAGGASQMFKPPRPAKIGLSSCAALAASGWHGKPSEMPQIDPPPAQKGSWVPIASSLPL